MIFLAITSIFIYGLSCHYFGHRNGIKEGIEMTKRDYNSKLNDHINNAFEQETHKIIERYERFLKDKSNE